MRQRAGIGPADVVHRHFDVIARERGRDEAHGDAPHPPRIAAGRQLDEAAAGDGPDRRSNGKRDSPCGLGQPRRSIQLQTEWAWDPRPQLAFGEE